MTTEPARDLYEDDIRDTAQLLSAGSVDAPDDKWPQTLAEMMDVLRATFRTDRDDEAALNDARAAVVALGQYLGGRNIYLPRGDRLATAVRDREIWLAWRGNNLDELALRYSLTTRRVEQILAEQRAIHVRRIQPQLFEQPD